MLIPALAYLEKFCIDGYKSGFRLMPQNWRTVVFTMLILSCKMWDDLNYKSGHDQSMARHNFGADKPAGETRIRNSQIQP